MVEHTTVNTAGEVSKNQKTIIPPTGNNIASNALKENEEDEVNYDQHHDDNSASDITEDDDDDTTASGRILSYKRILQLNLPKPRYSISALHLNLVYDNNLY